MEASVTLQKETCSCRCWRAILLLSVEMATSVLNRGAKFSKTVRSFLGLGT